MGEVRPSVAAPNEREDRGGDQPRRRSAAGAPPAPHELDHLIHQRVRLGIMSALAATERMSFNDLRDLLETSDGNLSVHARKLEEAGYLECSKRFVGRVPLTEYRLTPEGRAAFDRYIQRMEALFDLSRSS